MLETGRFEVDDHQQTATIGQLIEAATILGAPFGQGNGLAPAIPAEDVAKFVARFRLAVRPGQVTTWVGALACHWQFMDMNAGHPGKLQTCPLTAFLEAQGPGMARLRNGTATSTIKAPRR